MTAFSIGGRASGEWRQPMSAGRFRSTGQCVAPLRPGPRKRALACAAALALTVAPAQAGSLAAVSPAGRYALTSADCKAGEIFATLTDSAVTLPTYSCKGVDYDQTENKGGRALYAVSAKSCIGEEEAKGKPAAFKLVVEGDALQFLWSDGTQSAKLTRCAAKGRK